MNATIQGLWLGSSLSTMEKLCIRSFQENGHEFHLYCYEEIDGVPEGTVIKDGREILPPMTTQFGCVPYFSTLFRYNMLLKNGGWWVDMDVVCLKPFDFFDDFVLGKEEDGLIMSAVLKSAAGSDFMQYLLMECGKVKTSEWTWGQMGPQLITMAADVLQMQDFVHPTQTFAPVNHRNLGALVEDPSLQLTEESYAVHLWHEGWIRNHLDPDADYPGDCLYSRLKARYL